MRQTLTKGLVVAAAATSALTLSGTWAFADSGPQATGADSHTALSDDTAQKDSPAETSALKVIPGADAAVHQARTLTGLTAPASGSRTTKAGEAKAGKAKAGETKARETKAREAKADWTKGGEQGYGYDDESSDQSYGGDEHSSCSCHGEDTPTPTPTPPPHKSAPPVTPAPSKTPPAKPSQPPAPPAPPAMAKTGAEGTLAATAASGVLLAAGAVLYRRGRTSARR
ncbi:hypothetical protein [Streptomyces sp. NPDC046759]|uniref:hypothetical protein n=1 Tax=Streptomyces sp. NPDC046759 TaxID=3155019 RepID=UPI0033D98B1E